MCLVADLKGKGAVQLVNVEKRRCAEEGDTAENDSFVHCAVAIVC